MPREKNIGEKDDANQQVLQYGKDLAELYSAEKQKREELEIANMRLSTIFESSPDGLVVLNKKFIIIQANQAFENLLRMSPKEFLFLNISDALSSNALRDAIRLLEIGEVAKELEISINNPSRTFRVKISPMDKGNQSEWLMLFSDSSGQKILEKQKNDFISIASHELRTPLAQILGFTQVLSKENIDQLDSQGQEIISRIEKATLRLAKIVDQLLQFAENDKYVFLSDEYEEFDLAKIIVHIVSELEYLAEQNNVSVHLENIGSPVTLYNKAGFIQSAIHHLLLNAIMFNSDGGHVVIGVHEGMDDIQINIRDTGKGIAKEETDNIFGLFSQIEDIMTRTIGGLGLGLAIAQHAIQHLGGDLHVESKEKRGSTFTINMPRKVIPTKAEISVLKRKLDASSKQSLEYARDIRSIYKELQEHFVTTLASIIITIEAKDSYTRGHTERVGNFSIKMGKALGLSSQELANLETAVKIHDIGKIGVPDSVLNKPGRLTMQEYKIIKSHVNIGWDIIRPLKFLEDIAPVAFAHHENWDGTGYPNGLAREDIPLGARIIAIADAYDAMTSDRPYRKGMSKDKALDIINKGKDTQWDAYIVDVFSSILK